MALEVWTAATPNGWKVSIMVEELREAGFALPDLRVRAIELMKGEQFSAEFTAANPNQKIPVLIDGDRSIMESCAILQYLAEKHPTPMLPDGDRRWDVSRVPELRSSLGPARRQQDRAVPTDPGCL